MWGQANKESPSKIQVIQNRALRRLSFTKLHDPTAQLYKDFKLLKFFDIVHLQNCLFMNQNEQNEKLVKSFSELKYTVAITNYFENIFENPPGIFSLFTLLLEIPDKTMLHLEKIHKIVTYTSEIFRLKARPTLEIPHDFFLITPGNFALFLFN